MKAGGGRKEERPDQARDGDHGQREGGGLRTSRRQLWEAPSLSEKQPQDKSGEGSKEVRE